NENHQCTHLRLTLNNEIPAHHKHDQCAHIVQKIPQSSQEIFSKIDPDVHLVHAVDKKSPRNSLSVIDRTTEKSGGQMAEVPHQLDSQPCQAVDGSLRGGNDHHLREVDNDGENRDCRQVVIVPAKIGRAHV